MAEAEDVHQPVDLEDDGLSREEPDGATSQVLQLKPKRPSQKAKGKPPPRLSNNNSGRRCLTIASSSPVKQVAGSIAHTSRAMEPPYLSAVGPSSVNQAIKAIAVARTYLNADKIALTVQVSRPEGNTDIKDLILFNLVKREIHDPAPSLNNAEIVYTDLKSAASTGTGQLAGAIAKSIRETHRVRVNAIGPDSVFRAVDAIALARTYVATNGLDISFQPEFIQVQFEDGTQGNAIQFALLSQQI